MLGLIRNQHAQEPQDGAQQPYEAISTCLALFTRPDGHLRAPTEALAGVGAIFLDVVRAFLRCSTIILVFSILSKGV